MRLVRTDEESLTFHLSVEEQGVFTEILSRYPVVPPAHHRVSKGPNMEQLAECQQLLDEALAEQRKANRQHLQRWLGAPDRFESVKHGSHLIVKRADVELLLQVLNDVRVGSWVLLGEPEERLDPRALDPAQLQLWVGMELSAWFQMMLLEAAR